MVAQYLDESNNSVYGGVKGVICVRKYPDPLNKIAGNTSYGLSKMKTYLETDYMNNCSEVLRALISPIKIPDYGIITTSGFFSMSVTEVGGVLYNGVTMGFMWDYWKEKTNITTPTNNSNPGRIVRDKDGTARFVWLRGLTGVGALGSIGPIGSIPGNNPAEAFGVLPACFISFEESE